MTYKQIEASREARLWISQVIIPVIGIASMGAVPEVRTAIADKGRQVKESIIKRFKKEES